MLGTNPLSFGIPTDEKFPFILDCATSLVQRGKIEVYARAGKKLPEGWVSGEKGESLTDPHKVLEALTKGTASLAPLGGIGEETAGYKGYGYATVVEILSSALQNGDYLKMITGVRGGEKIPYHLGHFFIAINVSFFTALPRFKKTAGEILRALRGSKKAPRAERIYTAGEKEYLTWQKRKNKGVPLNKVLQSEILTMRDETGLKKYVFPFEK